MSDHDPELPAGFRDADFQLAQLEALGARSDALKRRGICTHGWFKAGAAGAKCLHCGKEFPTEEALHAERSELLG